MALIPTHFFKAIVAIGVSDGTDTQWAGTGFMYGYGVGPKDGKPQMRTFLVTNKHVLEGLNSVILRFETSSGRSSEFNISLLQNGKSIWTGHSDPEIDVAVIPVNGDFLEQQLGQVNVFSDHADCLVLNSPIANHLSEGDSIFLLGFPLGLVDKIENLPIVRGGTLARFKDCKAGRTKYFLIDSQNFPGNSGGPVLNRPEIATLQGTGTVSTAHLIGIVMGYYPTYGNEENSGLAIVFPVDCIYQTIVQTIEAEKSLGT